MLEQGPGGHEPLHGAQASRLQPRGPQPRPRQSFDLLESLQQVIQRLNLSWSCPLGRVNSTVEGSELEKGWWQYASVCVCARAHAQGKETDRDKGRDTGQIGRWGRRRGATGRGQGDRRAPVVFPRAGTLVH